MDLPRLASFPASWIDSGCLLDFGILQGIDAVLHGPDAPGERARGCLHHHRAAAAVRADRRHHGGMLFFLSLFTFSPPFSSSGVLQFLLS